MAVLSEQLPHDGGFLIKEFSRDYNREAVTVASGQTLRPGAVLGKITASGKYAAYDAAAEDGTETAACILYASVDASCADADGVVVVRGPAVVTAAELVYADDQDAADKAAAVANLADLGLIAR